MNDRPDHPADASPAEAVAIADDNGVFSRADVGVLPLYSITKTYIAAALFTLDIDIEAPISRWIDPALLSGGDRINVRQLLNHTSGLRDYGGLREYGEAIRSGGPVWSDEAFAAHTLQRGLLFEPGVRYGHNGGGPGYSASCHHFTQSGGTICVLKSTHDPEAAMHRLLAIEQALA